MCVAKYIKDQRLRLKLSQQEFAEKCGITNTHISKIENGKTDYVSYGVIAKMAEVIGHDPVHLCLLFGKLPKGLEEGIAKALGVGSEVSLQYKHGQIHGGGY